MAGIDEEQVTRVTPFDFVQTSPLSRYPQFRTQTRRHRNADVVEKVYLHDPISENDSLLHHTLDAEPWRHGIPLSNLWMQRLRIDPSHELFVQLSIEYFDYLKSRFDEAPDAGVLLDVLPMNIMVAPSGEWHSFDHEWTTTAPIDASFIFFRGLFYFCQAAQEILRAVYHNQPAWTLQAGLGSCFLAVGLNLESNLDKFIDWEETIQNTALKMSQRRFDSRFSATSAICSETNGTDLLGSTHRRIHRSSVLKPTTYRSVTICNLSLLPYQKVFTHRLNCASTPGPKKEYSAFKAFVFSGLKTIHRLACKHFTLTILAIGSYSHSRTLGPSPC